MIVLSPLAFGVLWLVGAAWLTRKLPIDHLIDKRRNEKWATQLKLEEQELPQMLAAANDYRRKRGLPEITVAQLQAQTNKDLREQIAEQAHKQQRAQRTHVPSVRERRGF
jgi:hypothetical protein